MENFGIIFDKFDFTSGEKVTGKVVIKTSKPVKARSLMLTLQGAAHTKWSESERHYSAEIDFVTAAKKLSYTRTDEGKIPPGYQAIPFSFHIPETCPPSFEGEYGHIRYSICAKLDRPGNIDRKEKYNFRVTPNTDLNTFPCGRTPISKKDVKDVGVVFKKGIVTMKAAIPKQAYVIGEDVIINIEINNASKRSTTCVRADIHQHSHYHAGRNSIFGSSAYYHEKDYTKTICGIEKNVKVASNSQNQIQLKIQIPSMPPTFHCPIIKVDYCLSVKLETETTFNNTLHCEFPLIIGKIPIVNRVVPTLPSVSRLVVARMESLPPAYSSVVPSDDSAGPSEPPPSYEESNNTNKL